MTSPQAKPLVEISDLHLSYTVQRATIQASRGASLTIAPGEAVGLVGESGSGKSTLARALLGLNDPKNTRIDSGSITVDGTDVTNFDEREWRPLRGSSLSMVFQDPLSFLNPVMRIDRQIVEAIPKSMRAEGISERVDELLRLVKLPEAARRSYPHELSGGMRQRVLLAIALASKPKLLVADEPTTALDVTTQAEIMDLLGELRQRLGMAMLLISHDLGLVSKACERIYVMYAGRTVEWGPGSAILKAPAHPYTKGLFDSARALRLPNGLFATIGGDVPNLAHKIEGCPFRMRCPLAMPRCTTMSPATEVLGQDGQWVRCWAAQDSGIAPAQGTDVQHA
jgi:oligopeptide/dipeptide ABC transporter ATP-binding protein